MTLAARLHRSATWHASRVAFVDGERSLTFAEAERRTNRLANAVAGVAGSGAQRVGVLLPNSLEFLEADLAIVKAVKTKVPLNVRLSASERAYILEDSGAALLITDAEGYDSVADSLASLEQLRSVIVVGDARPGTRSYEELLSEASDAPPALPEPPDRPSVILYTSGTTGRPKGAVSSFRARWLTTLNMLADELDVCPGDGMIHAGSLAHGSGSKSLAFFLGGARNIVMRKFDARAFLELAAREAATHSFLVPTMIAMLLDAVRAGAVAAPTLRTVTYGGAPIATPVLAEALTTFGNIFVQVYGSCEAPHPITVMTKSDHDALTARRSQSIGREVLAVETQIVDAAGRRIADGEAGELLIGGETLMEGYWNQPEATAAAFESGMYRTGDIASRDGDGYLYIVDRQREMIISGGLNVYPAEVERVIHEYPGVEDVAVVGIPDQHWGESVLAVVVRAPGATVSVEQIAAHCGDRLAGYKKPRLVEFWDDLPKGSTGKILKRRIRDTYLEASR